MNTAEQAIQDSAKFQRNVVRTFTADEQSYLSVRAARLTDYRDYTEYTGVEGTRRWCVRALNG